MKNSVNVKLRSVVKVRMSKEMSVRMKNCVDVKMSEEMSVEMRNCVDVRMKSDKCCRCVRILPLIRKQGIWLP